MATILQTPLIIRSCSQKDEAVSIECKQCHVRYICPIYVICDDCALLKNTVGDLTTKVEKLERDIREMKPDHLRLITLERNLIARQIVHKIVACLKAELDCEKQGIFSRNGWHGTNLLNAYNGKEVALDQRTSDKVRCMTEDEKKICDNFISTLNPVVETFEEFCDIIKSVCRSGSQDAHRFDAVNLAKLKEYMVDTGTGDTAVLFDIVNNLQQETNDLGKKYGKLGLFGCPPRYNNW